MDQIFNGTVYDVSRKTLLFLSLFSILLFLLIAILDILNEYGIIFVSINSHSYLILNIISMICEIFICVIVLKMLTSRLLKLYINQKMSESQLKLQTQDIRRMALSRALSDSMSNLSNIRARANNNGVPFEFNVDLDESYHDPHLQAIVKTPQPKQTQKQGKTKRNFSKTPIIMKTSHKQCRRTPNAKQQATTASRTTQTRNKFYGNYKRKQKTAEEDKKSHGCEITTNKHYNKDGEEGKNNCKSTLSTRVKTDTVRETAPGGVCTGIDNIYDDIRNQSQSIANLSINLSHGAVETRHQDTGIVDVYRSPPSTKAKESNIKNEGGEFSPNQFTFDESQFDENTEMDYTNEYQHGRTSTVLFGTPHSIGCLAPGSGRNCEVVAGVGISPQMVKSDKYHVGGTENVETETNDRKSAVVVSVGASLLVSRTRKRRESRVVAAHTHSNSANPSPRSSRLRSLYRRTRMTGHSAQVRVSNISNVSRVSNVSSVTNVSHSALSSPQLQGGIGTDDNGNSFGLIRSSRSRENSMTGSTFGLFSNDNYKNRKSRSISARSRSRQASMSAYSLDNKYYEYSQALSNNTNYTRNDLSRVSGIFQFEKQEKRMERTKLELKFIQTIFEKRRQMIQQMEKQHKQNDQHKMEQKPPTSTIVTATANNNNDTTLRSLDDQLLQISNKELETLQRMNLIGNVSSNNKSHYRNMSTRKCLTQPVSLNVSANISRNSSKNGTPRGYTSGYGSGYPSAIDSDDDKRVRFSNDLDYSKLKPHSMAPKHVHGQLNNMMSPKVTAIINKHKQRKEKFRKEKTYLDIAMQSTNLVTLSMISSISLFLSYLFVNSFSTFYLTLDCIFMSLTIYLSFSFSKNGYNYICFCHKCIDYIYINCLFDLCCICQCPVWWNKKFDQINNNDIKPKLFGTKNVSGDHDVGANSSIMIIDFGEEGNNRHRSVSTKSNKNGKQMNNDGDDGLSAAKSPLLCCNCGNCEFRFCSCKFERSSYSGGDITQGIEKIDFTGVDHVDILSDENINGVMAVRSRSTTLATAETSRCSATTSAHVFPKMTNLEMVRTRPTHVDTRTSINSTTTINSAALSPSVSTQVTTLSLKVAKDPNDDHQDHNECVNLPQLEQQQQQQEQNGYISEHDMYSPKDVVLELNVQDSLNDRKKRHYNCSMTSATSAKNGMIDTVNINNNLHCNGTGNVNNVSVNVNHGHKQLQIKNLTLMRKISESKEFTPGVPYIFSNAPKSLESLNSGGIGCLVPFNSMNSPHSLNSAECIGVGGIENGIYATCPRMNLANLASNTDTKSVATLSGTRTSSGIISSITAPSTNFTRSSVISNTLTSNGSTNVNNNGNMNMNMNVNSNVNGNENGNSLCMGLTQVTSSYSIDSDHEIEFAPDDHLKYGLPMDVDKLYDLRNDTSDALDFSSDGSAGLVDNTNRRSATPNDSNSSINVNGKYNACGIGNTDDQNTITVSTIATTAANTTTTTTTTIGRDSQLQILTLPAVFTSVNVVSNGRNSGTNKNILTDTPIGN